MYQLLKEQMHAYYKTMKAPDTNPDFQKTGTRINEAMDAWLEANPSAPAVLVKSKLHETIAEYFQPVIFPESPFFYEMGLRPSENWGIPTASSPSCWLLNKSSDTIRKSPLYKNILSLEYDGAGITGWGSVFDFDHHCINYTRMLSIGIDGLLRHIDEEAAKADDEKGTFCRAAKQSCLALLKIAGKFALKAEEMLTHNNNVRQRKFLETIANTACRIPACPPATFYEGLAFLWFLREATASLEGIGISVIGHIDRLLGPLYEADLQYGRITEEEAKDMLAIWMLPTDIKFDLENNNWPETSTCIELGGCDEEGKTVWNPVTRLVIEVHEKLNLLNPKLNCRYSCHSPRPYLEAIGNSMLYGHNNFSLINDDVVIPSLVKTGKTLRDARLYVNGGCQETITEGVEHSAGAFYYFSMPRLLDICLQGSPELPGDLCGPDTFAVLPRPIESADSFEEFYEKFFNGLKKTIAYSVEWRRVLGKKWRDINPCPLFSATLEGCVEKGMDYTAGGAKYNPATVCAIGLANVIDSLYAIKKAVYDERLFSLTELRQLLASNWETAEPLRQKFIHYPKYGHGIEEVDAMASEFVKALSGFVDTLVNERGGNYQLCMFTYYNYEIFSHHVRATPDGRKCGELLSQGIAPHRLSPVKSITDPIRTIGKIDFTDLGGNSVLDLQLPVSTHMDVSVLVGLLQAFAEMGGPTIQLNIVSVESLIDAKKHPEKYGNLIVRICGLSAYFVALTPEVQDEIIDRNVYSS